MKLTILLTAAITICAHAAPLKVYVLAGQSNMQGHASITTFDYLAKDPKTAPLLAEMRGKDGKPTVCERVWASYLSDDRAGNPTIKEGNLTVGFAAREDTIGPEFTFGITLQKLSKEPILIIKTAWGGKNLHTDFRPPSSSGEGAGIYYKKMVDHVKKVLADPSKVVPSYNAKDGYEIAGFLWLQGWNDLVDQSHYPKRGQPGGYDSYTQDMANFIRDVRKDFNAPKMPFCIGVLGVNGPTETFDGPRYKSIYQTFRDAQAAPADMPEFKGNVIAIRTEVFWDSALAKASDKKDRTPEEMEIAKGASNKGFHYYGAAKFFAPAGKAFAEALHNVK
ncbi:MAG: sialate O-acetylesterase [Verrucomicrobiota bacterium]